MNMNMSMGFYLIQVSQADLSDAYMNIINEILL